MTPIEEAKIIFFILFVFAISKIFNVSNIFLFASSIGLEMDLGTPV